MAKGPEVVWRWKGAGHLGLSMVVLGTHDTLGLGPPLSPPPCVGKASLPSAQTATVSLSFVSGCPPPPLHPPGCGLCSPGKPAPAAGGTRQESG